MFKKLGIVIIMYLCLTACLITGQTEGNKELTKLLDKINQQEFLFTGLKLNRKSIRTANKLYQLASEEDLIRLSKMDCKLCFSYSFWVLSKKEYKHIDKIYQDYYTSEKTNFIEINKAVNSKSCIKFIYVEDHFIDEVHKEKKYLDEIN